MSTPVTTANTTLAIQMPYIAASASCLNQLAQSLNSYPTTDICGNKINTAVAIAAFLNNQSDQNSYNTMSTAITSWLSQKTSDKTGPFLALGLKPEWNTNKCFQYGIRVQVLFANGYTVYDSNSNTNNQFGNINVPRTTFLADGKWLINENQATRSYNMGATLSNNGIFYQTAHSATVLKEQMYLSMRQGNSPAYPIGNLVISMNTCPNDLNPVPTLSVAGDQ